MDTINKRIKDVLDNSGLSAAEFAEKLSVQRSSISHILSGRNKPSLDFITKLHKAFPAVDIQFLITGEPAVIKQPQMHTAEDEGKEKEVLSQDNRPVEDVTNVNHKESDAHVTNVNPPAVDDTSSQPRSESEQELNVTSSKRVSKIILLYEDGRFQEFTP